VDIPYGTSADKCPVRAIERWLGDVGTALPDYKGGPLFLQLDAGGRVRLGRLSDRGVARVVQRWAERAALDPACFAGHSVRAGLATSAAGGGISERAIMNQTGHRSLAVVRRCIRDGDLFRDRQRGQRRRSVGRERRPSPRSTLPAALASHRCPWHSHA